ncbi:hypothetical protein HZH68_012769 [Vespula germanica]|uniref:Uncharacterized protein n=1 Tax=Vespula germanica TaxID=30212 RepID=A0A834MVP8_VESGE|nr:hypothetical protein HZH68_012769 [Vespula germanica]
MEAGIFQAFVPREWYTPLLRGIMAGSDTGVGTAEIQTLDAGIQDLRIGCSPVAFVPQPVTSNSPSPSPSPSLLGSVLRMRIYGLFNGGRLQIRRAVNQRSNGPHHAAALLR